MGFACGHRGRPGRSSAWPRSAAVAVAAALAVGRTERDEEGGRDQAE